MLVSRHGLREISLAIIVVALAVMTGSIYLIVPTALLFLFVLYFFRDPIRKVEKDGESLLSPADGVVDTITDCQDNEFLGRGEFRKIGIFLALYNVHVNRAPVDGRIEKIEYRKGQFVTAMREDSSHINEANNVVISMNDGTRMLLRQVAGVAARRIIFEYKEGDKIEQGSRIGMIKFGSRTEIFLPKQKITDILVKEGDKVKGAISRLAKIKV